MKSPYTMIKQTVVKKQKYTLPEVRYKIKLNQNENPYDLPDEVKEDLFLLMKKRPWNRYPELGNISLRCKLAKWLGLPPEAIVVGNGSNEVMLAVLTTILEPGKRMVTVAPTFSLYTHYADILGAETTVLPLGREFCFPVDQLKEKVALKEVALTILCSPNNPTGNVLPMADLREILEAAHGFVLVDEAYIDFTEQNALPLLNQYGNLILTRTFSKAFAFSFGRFGYGLLAPELAHEVSKTLLPYNLNGFTEMAVEVLLNNQHRLNSTISLIKKERQRLFDELSRLNWLKVFPSHANFLLIEPKIQASLVFKRLLDSGILVRNVSSYPGLGNHLRLSVGTPEENDTVLEAFKKISMEVAENMESEKNQNEN